MLRALLPACLVLGLTGLTGPASADSVASAQNRAAVLRAQLEALQARADQAVEHYDLAQGQLGTAVTRRLSLDAALQAARQDGGAQQAVHADRVRALYMSGGVPALYATVLAARSLGDVVDRIHAVQRVMAGDRAGIQTADQVERGLAAAEAQAQRAAADQTRLSARTQALAEQVQTLIADQRDLLAGADQRVLVLEQAQAQAATLASARAFAVQLAAAQAQSGTGAFPGGGSSAAFPAGILAPNAAIAAVLTVAEAQLGKPYVWGAVGPDSFDCSGLIGFAYAAAGIALPRTAAQQYLTGPHPSIGQLQPGDLLFWAPDPSDWHTIDHVGMYLGGGQMIVAPHTGDVVKVQAVYADGFFGATRVDPAVSGQVPGPQWVNFPRPRS